MSKSLNINLSTEEFEELKRMANERDKSSRWIVKALVKLFIENIQENEKKEKSNNEH